MAAVNDFQPMTMVVTNPVGLESHQVHPYWAFIQEIIEELNEEDLHSLKMLARDKLGDDIHDVTNLHEFFFTLEKTFGSRFEDMIKFLKNIWSAHVKERFIDLGEDTLLRKLENCQEKILTEKQRMQEYGIHKDEKFVGRREELMAIGKFLKKQTPTIAGVCICGMAGMGKTSLATEVCFWTKTSCIIKIDKLRGKKTLSDLFISILHGLAAMCPAGETEEAEFCESTQQSEERLRSMVHHKLTALSKDTIIFVDNIDDVYTYNSTDLLKVLQRILDIENDKVKFVLTSRQKLVHFSEDPGNTTFTPRMGGALLEVELGYLSIPDAKQLLLLYAGEATIDNDDAREIVQLCKQCPLVVKMVGTHLNSGGEVTASMMRRRLLANDRHLGEALQIEHCINEMFEALQPETSKTNLIQLSVFETSFDTSMVMAVIDIADSVESQLNTLKRSHIIEVDNVWEENFMEQNDSVAGEIKLEYPQSSMNDRSAMYSFHPLVLAFLQTKSERENSEVYFSVKKEAELRFLQYFVECIKNNLGRNLDKRSASAFAYIDDKKVHLQKFLRLVSDGHLEFYARNKKDVRFLHGLCKVRSFVGNRLEQIDFYQKLVEKKEAERDQMCTFFLKTQEMLIHTMVQNVNSIKFLKGQLKTMLPNIEAMSATEEPLKPLALADYYNMLGSITMDSAKYQVEHTMERPILREALKYFEKALENYQKRSSSQVDIAQVTNSKGCVYFQLHNYPLSLKLHVEAYHILKEYIKSEMHTDIPNYLVNIGSVFQSMGNELVSENEVQANNYFDKALQRYAEALQIDRKLGFPNELCEARRLRNKAELHKKLKQFNEAESDAMRAFRMFQKNFQPPHTELTMTLHVMGFVQYSKGKHLRAAANNMLSEEAERAFVKSGEYYGHVRRMIQTGGLPEGHHDYQRIRKIHEDVLEALGKVEDLMKVRKFYRDFEAGKFNNEIRRIQRDMEGQSSSSDSASEHEESDQDNYSASSSEEEMDQGGPPIAMGRAEGGLVGRVEGALVGMVEGELVGGAEGGDMGGAGPPQRQDSGFDSLDLDGSQSAGKIYEEFRGMGLEENVFEENAEGGNPGVGNLAADPQQPLQQPRSRNPLQRQASVPKKRKMTDGDEDLC